MTKFREGPYDLGAGVRPQTHDPITGVRILTSDGVALGSMPLPVTVYNFGDAPIMIDGTSGPMTAVPGDTLYLLKCGITLTVGQSPMTREQIDALIDTVVQKLGGFQDGG